MINVAFTPIGGEQWTGGTNYLVNLLGALEKQEPSLIQAHLFVGLDFPESALEPYCQLTNLQIVRDEAFNTTRRSLVAFKAVVLGRDSKVVRSLRHHGINVVYESAVFFGWRIGFPTVAWFPDFQHKELRHHFSLRAYWRRELGFRLQVIAKRKIIVSSTSSASS